MTTMRMQTGVNSVSVGDVPSDKLALLEQGWSNYDIEMTCGSPMERLIMQNGYHYLKPDPYGPERKRAYLKLDLDVATGTMEASADQSYSQTYKANDIDGGKVRHFEPMPDELVGSVVFQRLVAGFVKKMLSAFDIKLDVAKVGVHAVRYETVEGQPSFSSPIWLHKDDEPVVFVTVIDETEGLIGGDSIIAQTIKSIERVTHLAPFEGVLLTKSCLHAVTPMEAPSGCKRAHRDILLVTLEEPDDVVVLKPVTEAPEKKAS